jgi:hypothetical protein
MSDLVLGLILGFAAGILCCWTVLRFRPAERPAPRTREETAGAALLESLLGNADAARDLRQDLRLKFGYDEVKIDRAIAYERERQPNASDEELMQAAIARWERDNH